jgi:mutator protein MutT
MPGYWEFPGGKCHAGESLKACAEREGTEEAGVAIRAVRLRMMREHIYPHGWVKLAFYDCETVDPDAEPGAETGFRWVAGIELGAYRFPDGNGAVLAELVRESEAELRRGFEGGG